MTFSEVESVTGFVGNFQVTVRKKARYVNPDECTACAECAKVCPVAVPDEYQQGFSSRKAIYLPFPQAVPSSYILEMDNCLGNNPIACGKCAEACEKHCIDYDDQDKLVNFEVGVIIAATGMDVYDPTDYDEYGYTRFENVITSMEFERLICAGGPTEGHFIRPSDRKIPQRIGFIQCVGSRSRDGRGNPYCSNICCMNTVKDTLLLCDHYPGVEAKVFYMDMRSFGKGFEDLYMRSREEGVKYIRGIPGEVVENPESRNLVLTVENTTTGKLEQHELEMLVLSQGVIPRRDGEGIRKLLTLSTTSDGFIMESHPKLKPVDAPTRGVYIAGCVESPKDVKDSVTQASAAAARASILLNAGKTRIEAITSQVDADLCNYCGICAKVCPYNAIMAPDRKEKKAPVIIQAACAGCGACAAECPQDAIAMRHFKDEQIMAQIEGVLAEHPHKHLLTFACNWCSYAGGDMAGTARLQYPTTCRLIRTMCSGRVDEKFVIHAFRLGAPMVLVSGCHFADCHYINAVHWTQKRMDRLWNRLDKLGIRPDRLQLEWISAAEGQKFARVMRELEDRVKAVTSEEIEHTMKVLADEEAKVQKRKEKPAVEVTVQ
ncbi:MAG: hydrogenase iron-sulfur subunit [candidate division Zixibacteria bacterium]|nr:hydrogenase iron-sulfur subunit [candidate division Zixibacteria bacterium]